MDDKPYQTKYISLAFLTNSQVRINSDGWVECGEYSLAEANQLLSELTQQGWTLVGSCGQKHLQGVIEAMDLYFRREKTIQQPLPETARSQS